MSVTNHMKSAAEYAAEATSFGDPAKGQVYATLAVAAAILEAAPERLVFNDLTIMVPETLGESSR